MSDVQAQAADAAALDQTATMSEDEALGALFDQANADTGQERGEDGKFTSGAEPEPEAGAEEGGEPDLNAAEAVEGEGEEGDDEGQPDTNAPAAVPLPANWTGMDEDWKKIPADVQAKIAARDTELHARMSEAGRQLGAVKPITDILDRNRDLLEGRTDDQGQPITSAYAVDFLMAAQRSLDRDPVRSILDIAARYNVLPQIAGVLSGQIKLPPAQQPQQAGVKPADVQAMVKEAMTADQQTRHMEAELSRMSKDKPLYAEIHEADMVHSIQKARRQLGDTASNEAVFNMAYDMAVHADPSLRAKAAAAAKPVAQPDPKKTQDAQRAASINVSSRSSGKTRQPTEDEALGAAFDAAHKDR